MKTLTCLALAAALAMAAGCYDNKSSPANGSTMKHDGGLMDDAKNDGGMSGDGSMTMGDGGDASGKQTLVEFVTDIINNHTGPTKVPMSVDKTYEDTTDPNAFNMLLQIQ